jgi:Ca-activated chloride channel family protein
MTMKRNTRQNRSRLAGTALFITMALLGGCSSSNPQPSPYSNNHYGGAENDFGGASDCIDSAEVSAYGGYDASAQDGGAAYWATADVSSDIPSGGWNPGNDPDNPGCIADCEGLQCGPDGCGGSCGWCSAAASCQEGGCVVVPGCSPECAGKMVGEADGCGGLCSGGGFGIGLKPGGAQDVGYFRKLVAQGQVPTSDFFPIEGFLNEHDTPLPAPNYDMLATLHAFVGLFYDPQADAPVIAMQLGLNSGLAPEAIEAKPFNLVVVVDVSGSMSEDGKIAFIREGLHMMVESLDDNDRLSIVAYDDVADVRLGPTLVTEEARPLIHQVIDGLTPGGSTNIFDGLQKGYEMAMIGVVDSEAMHRVLFMSDGLATAGETGTANILNMSASYHLQGIGITTLGVGTNFNFDLMYGLANQGNGNFYFLDDGEKMVQVFEHELEYLLTPVADNLKISFTLPKEFFVQDIYGFEFEQLGDEVVLLGPSPQYSVTPPDETPGGGPGNGGGVAVSTLFASKKNGLLMVRIGTTATNVVAAFENLDFAKVTYSYELAKNGTTEMGETIVHTGSLSYFAEDGTGPMAYFSGPIMQRNFCILRTGLAIRQAVDLYHQEPMALNGAIAELNNAMTFCNGINLALSSKDPEIEDDVTLMQELLDNMCSQQECILPTS